MYRKCQETQNSCMLNYNILNEQKCVVFKPNVHVNILFFENRG